MMRVEQLISEFEKEIFEGAYRLDPKLNKVYHYKNIREFLEEEKFSEDYLIEELAAQGQKWIDDKNIIVLICSFEKPVIGDPMVAVMYYDEQSNLEDILKQVS